MNSTDRGKIVGMVLGDGHLSFRKRYNKDKHGTPKYEYLTSAIVIAHSMKQYDYLEHKRNVVHSVFGGNKPEIAKYDHTLPSTGKTYQLARFQKTNTYLRILHGFMYSNKGKKYISKQVLDMLTPEGIAYWYMDDGAVHRNKNANGDTTSCNSEIATYCSKEEVDNICEYFDKKYDIKFKPAYDKARNKYFVRTNTAGSKKFVELVKPYIVPCMIYKIQHVADLIVHEHQAPQSKPGDDIV
jgi:hypothetical protein